MPVTFLWVDLAQYAAATLLALILLLGPGFGLVALAVRFGALSDREYSLPWAMVLGVTLLPAVDALAIRYLGIGMALALHAGLALAGTSRAVRQLRRIPVCWYAVALAWWGIVAFAYVDVELDGQLYQSLAILDLVKHAAVVRTIAHDGLPLHDMFFARPGIAGYYYYFYIGPALIHWVGREVIDARASFMAASYVTGLVFPQLVLLIGTKAKLIPPASRRRFLVLSVLLCAVSGFDLVPGILDYLVHGTTLVQLDWWGEETRWALTSIVWVPHHISALIAVFVGCLLLAEASKTGIAQFQYRLGYTILSGLAFATAFGSSIWITVVAVPILGIWWLAGSRRTDMPPAWMLPASGCVALILVLPQVHDLVVGRTSAGFPLTVYVRPFGQGGPFSRSSSDALIRIALLPGSFAIEFGLFALGAIAFAASGRARQSWSNPIGRLLIIGATISLIAASFVRSTVINNDFGWRAIWFAQFSALVWTAAILTEDRQWLRGSTIRIAALALGVSATTYDLIGLRFIRAPYFKTQMSYINRYPDNDGALRLAYTTLDRTIPHDAVVQHNPRSAERVFDFGLYGHHRVAVADEQAQLFGADKAQVDARITHLMPLFTRTMPFADVRSIARQNSVDYLLITSMDPVWNSKGHAPGDWTCIYRSQDVCVAAASAVRRGRQ